jgi:hypothetical protein
MYDSLGDDLPELVFGYLAAPTAAVLATVCSDLGEARGAAQLFELMVPYAEQIASHPCLWFGSFSHHLARLAATLGRLPEADEHFARAAAIHERIGATTWLARTRLEWAQMLLRRRGAGDEERASNLLRQSLQTARQQGLRNLERQAAETLATL